MPAQQKRFYSVKDASKIIGVSTNTIYTYLDEGSLKGKRLNNRGRFKIPYSEIAPYLDLGEISTGTINPTEKPQAGKKNGLALTFFELAGVLVVGFAVFNILPNFNRGAIGDVENAVWDYSGRTFSGFGNYVSKALPAFSGNQVATTAVQNTANVTQLGNQNDTVKLPLLGIDTAKKTPDLSYKITDSESRTNDLYANVQVLSSNARNLLGKSKTLTSAELNSELDKMSKFLGAPSDSSDKGTIFAEINWLSQNWDFSSIKAARLAASQVGYLMTTLTSQSLAAFTKPDLGDLNNLVNETDSLLGAIGNLSDTSAEKTLYGSIKVISEANGSGLTQVSGQTVDESLVQTVTPVEPVFAPVQQTASIPEAGQVAGVATSNFQPQNMIILGSVIVIFISGLVLLVVFLKSILSGGNRKPLFSAFAETSILIPEDKSDAGSHASSARPPRVSFSLPKVEFRAIKKVIASITKFFLKLLTSIKKFLTSLINGLYRVVVAVAMFPVKVIRAAVSATVSFFRKIWFFVVSVVTFVVKTLVSIKTYIFKIPGAILIFILKVISLVKKFFISQVTGFYKLVTSVIHAIKTFFVDITSAIKKAIISVKTGILTILISGTSFFVKILSLTKKLVVSIITGLVDFTIAIATSLQNGLRAIARAIKTFFVNIVSAVTKVIISIKKAILAILVSIMTFFQKIILSIVNFITAIVTSLKNGFRAVIRAIKTFFVNIVSAAAALIASVKRVILAVATSIKAFFLKVLSTTFKLVFSIVTGLVNFIAAIVTSIKKGINMIINAVITFLAKTLSAITNAVISTLTALQKVAISITTFFLKILSKVVRTVAFVIRRLLKILTSVAKFADSTLTRLDFKTPTVRKTRSNFRNAATFLLIGVICTTILGVLVFKVIPFVKADSRGILGKEAIGSNEEMKTDGPEGESTVLIRVPDSYR